MAAEGLHLVKESQRPNRTIMLLGATGSGKSTLINGMINYMVGVEWSDSFRFQLINEDSSRSQAHSQTSEVNVYKIYHQDGFKIPYSLTVIDTPGFGDTRGIDRDREITQQLQNLFTSEDGVSEIDAVCFVAQAALARLTPTQKYVLDSILSIFGKDIAEYIRILVTFADGRKPPVLEAIIESGVPCPKDEKGQPVHFNFNNSALFVDNKSSAADKLSEDSDEENFDLMFWNMGTKSMKKFFDALNNVKTKSLVLTKQVLREREMLEVSIENLQEHVRLGLAKLEEIRKMKEKIKENEAEISRNENFVVEDEVQRKIQVPIGVSGIYATNCPTWQKMTVEGLMRKLEGEYNEMENEVNNLMAKSAKCLNRLKEIALKPNPLSTPEYIEMLIKGEKQEAKPGWDCVLSPLLFTLMAHDCVTSLILNVEKTKVIIVDFRKNQPCQARLLINSSAVEVVSSTKFLAVHITDNLS
ncbi:immune-associated nucleotide-binding protein 13-like [Fundulus heteroclitus]|uniref:immune-associated nucleotide-binding protein 13-like n=1 Tax=Fundulus heteroclitus TaxID=8078 RepID=UPI00165B78EF|nr:immune-associated nucleotide-binding protein 13-like [Fundulus heteroclitus]